jgi:hypothetical protein
MSNTPSMERKTTADQTVSAFDAAAVTKSDTTILPTTRGLWVGGAGDLSVKMNSGATVSIIGVAAGTLLPFQVIQVLNATTATNILALY